MEEVVASRRCHKIKRRKGRGGGGGGYWESRLKRASDAGCCIYEYMV